MQRNHLTAPIPEKEIEITLRGIGDPNALDLNGYGTYFFKKAWSIVKYDVVKVVHGFFLNVRFYKEANFTLVILIPKSKEATNIKEYKHISYCSTAYKIISKVLTTRMCKVLKSIEFHKQAAFIPDQVIHNHILLTYELIKGYNRKRGTPKCMIQLDIQKAYDTVDWRAMECVLKEVGFSMQFINKIMVAIKSVSYRFNINGEYTRVIRLKEVYTKVILFSLFFSSLS